MIRPQEKPKVHIMTYTAPVPKNMLHFNRLLYYVIPSLPIDYTVPDWLSIELGIFAGRLYMNFADCTAVKRYPRLEVNSDAENIQSSSENVGVLTNDPINFLLNWLTLRRKGHDIMHTPMGYVCQGRLLHQNHPFFATRSADAGDTITASAGGQGIGGSLEEEEEEEEKEEEEEDTDLEDGWIQ